jgi:hypothetical protein
MRVYPDATTSGGSMAAMGGASGISFIVPLLAGISLLMFALTLAITLSPSEAEIHEDAVLKYRMETEFADGRPVHSGGAEFPAALAAGAGRPAPAAGAANAFTPGGYGNGNGYANGNGYGNGSGQNRAYGDHGGNQFGGDQPGPSARALPTRRPPRDGGAPGSP